MECFECRLPYEGESRRPKLLPCGHTYCFPCLEKEARCFKENKVFASSSSDLPDDLYLLRLLARGEPAKRRGKLRLWCETCGTAAAEPCLDAGHKLCSMKKHLHRQTLARLREVRTALEEREAQGEAPTAEPTESITGAVDLTLEDGEDSWTVTVQLDGSSEESTPESWAMRLLLRELHSLNKLQPESPLMPLFVDRETEKDYGQSLGFGLFDSDYEDSISDQETEGGLEAGLAVMEEEEKDETVLDCLTDITEVENLSVDRLAKVRTLLNVPCRASANRALQLLEQNAWPHLEALQLRDAGREHLLAAHRIPSLRRLELLPAARGALCDDPFQLPALEHGAGLEHVRLAGISDWTAASLLLAHQRTLRTVQILPVLGKAPGPPPGVRFEELHYRGRGRVGEPIKCCPIFPRRPAGAFPMLQRIEFVELVPKPHNVRYPPVPLSRKVDLDSLRAMFPGVAIENRSESTGEKGSDDFMRGHHSNA